MFNIHADPHQPPRGGGDDQKILEIVGCQKHRPGHQGELNVQFIIGCQTGGLRACAAEKKRNYVTILANRQLMKKKTKKKKEKTKNNRNKEPPPPKKKNKTCR